MKQQKSRTVDAFYDRIEFAEATDVVTGKLKLQALYRAYEKSEIDIDSNDYEKEDAKYQLAMLIRKRMVNDLASYFNGAFSEDDILWLIEMSRTKFDRIRTLDRLTEYLSMDEIRNVLSIYKGLQGLGIIDKPNAASKLFK